MNDTQYIIKIYEVALIENDDAGAFEDFERLGLRERKEVCIEGATSLAAVLAVLEAEATFHDDVRDEDRATAEEAY